MNIDLHIHTVFSDGAWSPEAVVEGAIAGGLNVIAVADHDTAEGVPYAVAAAEGLPLRVVPAVELSSTAPGGRELHFLGYFIDPRAPSVRSHGDRAGALRAERIGAIIERLEDQGIHVDIDDVLEAAGPRRAILGRPHLARAMVHRGIVKSVDEAFDRFIGDRHPAFVPTALSTPAEALEVIREAGGVSVWAHPPRDLVDSMLPELVRLGLQGLEVYRPALGAAHVRRLEAAAKRNALVVSGGSDWHGPDRNHPLGTFSVSGSRIADLMEAGGL